MRRLALVAALSLGPAFALGAHTWADPQGRLLGHVLGEQLAHLWLQWIYTRLPPVGLFAYDGVVAGETVTVVPTDLLTHLLVAPLQAAFGLVLAYNLVVTAYVAAGGMALGATALRLGASPGLAALAALATTLDPALRLFLADGRYDSVAVGTVGVATWALVAAAQAPSRARLAGLALAGAAVAWAGPNVAIAGATVLVPAGIWAAWRERRVLLGLGGAALLALPWVLTFALTTDQTSSRGRETHHGTPLVALRSEAEVGADRLKEAAVATVSAAPVVSTFFMPERIRSTQWHAEERMRICGGTLAGQGEGLVLVVPLLAALLGRRPLLFAGLLALHFLATGHGAVHSLGLPVGERRLVFSAWALVGGLPGLGPFRNFGLFSVLAGGLGALAVARSGSRLAAVALVAELLWRGGGLLPAVDLRPPRGLVEALRGEGAVAVFPHGNEVAHLVQIWHRRPSLEVVLYDPRSCYERPAWARDFFADPPAGAERLAAEGVTEVLLLPEAMEKLSAERLEARLRAGLGRPRAEGPGWRIWRIGGD